MDERVETKAAAAAPAPPPVVQTTARIVDNRPITPDSYIVTLETAGALERSLPGQFVHARLGDGLLPFLRRPFSILSHRPRPGGGAVLAIMYAVVGTGTRALAGARPGSAVDLLGPLGNGFHPAGHATWVLAAGGRGAAPLFRLLEAREERGDAGAEVVFLFGARSREHLWWTERLEGVRHAIATDDGSAGRRGTVVDLLGETLAAAPPSPLVLACGPEPMLAAVAREAERAGVPAQVSLESIMGCALGLCRGCVIPRHADRGSPWPRDGNDRYATVCKEGPVFLGSEVDWDSVPHR